VNCHNRLVGTQGTIEIGRGFPAGDVEDRVLRVKRDDEEWEYVDCDGEGLHGTDARGLGWVFVNRAIADAEDAGVTLGVEPLNTIVDHPGYYLTSSAEGFEIVDAVDSPAVKLLFDVYHQQTSEGNVTRNLTNNVEQVGYVHVADVPGRHEPTTGKLDYENVLGALDEAGYDGYVGCEFTPRGDPLAAIENCRNMLS